MKQRVFEAFYQPTWELFTSQLEKLEGSKKENKIITSVKFIDFPENYQSICQHLAIAETRAYSPLLIKQLRQLVQRGHQILYQHRNNFLQHILRFIYSTLPQSIRAQKKLIISTTLLFYGLGLVAAIINFFFPDFIYFFMSPSEVFKLELMYEPITQSVDPLSIRENSHNWFMFGVYILNNISIAFTTFATGLLLCLGTLFYLAYNAIVIGLVASHLTSNGYGQTFWPFVIGHGAFELTAITLAAAAGLRLGLGVLLPKRKTRLESIRYAANQSINLVLGSFILLLIAALIEAYWSSINTAPTTRYIIGFIFWMMVFSYFIFGGRKRQL